MRQMRAAFMRPGPVQQRGQFRPRVVPVRPALDDDVIDEPAFQAATPGPDIDLDPVLLDVGPGGQEQPARWHRAGCPALAPVVEPLPVGRFAGLDPGLAEDRVAERLDRLVRPLRRVPCPHDPLPAQPADRRIERREVIPDRGRIGGSGGRPPFAALQHRRLVVLRDGRLAALAVIFRRLRAALLPAQPVELQPLHRAAMRARHEEPPLVAGLVFPLDPAQPPDGRASRPGSTLRRWAKVSDRASASVTGSPSSSAEAG